jgi:hypothetical protein
MAKTVTRRLTEKQAYRVWGASGYDYGYSKMTDHEARQLIEAGAIVVWTPGMNERMIGRRETLPPDDLMTRPMESDLPERYA